MYGKSYQFTDHKNGKKGGLCESHSQCVNACVFMPVNVCWSGCASHISTSKADDRFSRNLIWTLWSIPMTYFFLVFWPVVPKCVYKTSKCTLVLWRTFIYNTFTNMFRLVIRPSSGCCFWYKNTIVAKCVTVTTWY